ncbi:MAG: helix-turn-helix transcriptional regulator [Cyclobacteriaceae bacterium]|nr:helix-turn-helix transcriptional regulator [Cyclobacteriaceae bacterium HetDA_MAG_MS6]
MSFVSTHSFLLVMGALQGLLLSFMMAFGKRGNLQANRILSLLIGAFSVNILIMEVLRNAYLLYPHLLGSNFPLYYLFGPLLWWYSRQLTNSSFVWRRELLHLIPFVVGCMALMPLYWQSASDKVALYEAMNQDGLPTFLVVGWMLECMHLAIYATLSIQQLRKYQLQIRSRFSNIDRINLNWLKKVITANLVIWVTYELILINYLLGFRLDLLGLSGYVLGYLSSFFIYIIGYMSIKQPEIFLGSPSLTIDGEHVKTKYYRSGLTPQKASEYQEALIQFMEEESPHLNPDLTLQDLSEALSIPANHLSQVINEKFECNFFDYINGYRIKESKEWMADSARNQATMLQIAFESGFKSKSTFNAAFKKHQGQTPSQFKKQQNTLRSA